MTHRRRWPLLALLAPSVAALFSGAVSWAAGSAPAASAAPAPTAGPDADELRRTVAEQAGTLKLLRATVRRLEAQVEGLRGAPKPGPVRLHVRRPAAVTDEQAGQGREPRTAPSHPAPRSAPTAAPPTRRTTAPTRRTPPRSTPTSTRPTTPTTKPITKPTTKPTTKPAPRPAPVPTAPAPTPPPVHSTGS